MCVIMISVERADNYEILLVDAGHAETEKFVTVGMLRAAQRAIQVLNRNSELVASHLFAARTHPNSVRYY